MSFFVTVAAFLGFIPEARFVTELGKEECFLMGHGPVRDYEGSQVGVCRADHHLYSITGGDKSPPVTIWIK